MNRSKTIPVLIVILALTARLIPGVRTIDDSYITFRYARNLLAGEGFVYNPGEAILGTTTTLYALLMTGLGALTGGVDAPFPQLALGINALADAATVWLLWALGRKLKARWAGTAAALVWAVAPYSVTFAIGGLETSLYVFLLTAAVYAYLDRRYPLAALLSGLAFLTRPDALILVAPLTLDRLIRSVRKSEPKIKILEVLALSVLPLAWIVFATCYFGSPIPHSVQAKIGAYHLESTEALVRLLQHYATPFMEENVLGIPAIGVGLVIYPALYLIGGRAAYRREKRLLSFILYPWLYLIIFAAANPLIFRWYLTPPLPAYFFFILFGMEELLTSLLHLPAQYPLVQRSWKSVLLVGCIFIFPLSFLLASWELHPDHGPDRPAPQMAWYKLELLYQQAAEIAAPYLDENSLLAAGDVGVLGYTTGVRILDTVGLNSQEPLAYYPLDDRYYVINYAIPPDLIIAQQPDLVIFLEVYGREGLLKDPRFTSQYELVQKLPTDIYTSDGMLIYRHR